MSRKKRLFLFAGYDKDGIIDDALIHYVSSLVKFGDIIVCMDSDCSKSETDKLKKYTIHTITQRHGEYDFGSYKRCYQYARDNKMLDKYDTIYLVNDSVFGPMFDMTNVIENIEKIPTDAAGLVVSKHKTHKFMESWFIRLNKKVFLSDWFDEFISNVKHEELKQIITIKYEHGLTNVIKNNGCSWAGLYEFYGRYTYNNPKKLFIKGCPFVKKSSFIRHYGDCGSEIQYILNHADQLATKSVLATANRVYGEKYMNKFLTNNPIKIFTRKIKYLIQKIQTVKNEKN